MSSTCFEEMKSSILTKLTIHHAWLTYQHTKMFEKCVHRNSCIRFVCFVRGQMLKVCVIPQTMLLQYFLNAPNEQSQHHFHNTLTTKGRQ